MLKSKIAVVTGAASGIGRAIAVRLAESGCAHLVLGDVAGRRDGDRSVVDEVTSLGAKAEMVTCDVRDPDSVAQLVAAAVDLGGVDVMVNNAGVFRGGPFLETAAAQIDDILDVNVKGVFWGAQAAARTMVARGSGGVIVNVASTASDHGSSGQAAYHASKGAVRSLTFALAAELGPHGIRVNAVHPGAVDTAMLREDIGANRDALAGRAALRRLVTPQDVAGAVVYLASDLSGGVTGTSHTVDCGLFVSG